MVSIFVVEFSGCNIESDAHLLGGVACCFNGANHVLQALFVGWEIWCKAAFITNSTQKPVRFEFLLERMVCFNACSQSLFKGVKTVWHDHKFLNINV